MLTQSREHLRRNGMTYASHMRFAAYYGALCIWSGLLLLVHAVVPACFQAVGSRLVRRLSQSFGHDGSELQDHEAGSIW